MSFTRKSTIALAAATAIAGTAGAYVYFNGLPGQGGGDGTYGSAKLVPDEAMAAVAILNNGPALEQLGSFGSSQTQAQADSALQDFKQQTLEDTGLSLDQDILPLLDGVLIALLPPTSIDAAGAPELLTVLSTNNPVKALGLLSKAQEGAEVEVTTSDYRGVSISELTRPLSGSNVDPQASPEASPEANPQASSEANPESSPTNKPFFAAVVNQRLVIAASRRPVELAIEASQGEGSLADLPQAAQALKTSGDQSRDDQALARLYVPDYGALISQSTALSPDAAPISPEALAQLEKVNSIAAELSVEAEGLHLQATTLLDPSLRPAEATASPSKAVDRFPAETVAFFTGQGISQSWAKVTEQSASLPESAQVLELMRNASKQLDVDLDRDVFGWMTGELAFGLVPVTGGLVGQVGVGAAVVVDSGDRPATEALFTKLDKLAAGNQLKVDQKTVGKQAITAWGAPIPGSQESLLGRGWLDNDSLFVALGDNLVTQMAAVPQQALPSSPVFQSIMDKLPKDNLGYGFVNVEQALVLATRSPLASQLDPQVLEVLRMVEGIGLATTWDKADTSKLELFVSLKSEDELEAAAK